MTNQTRSIAAIVCGLAAAGAFAQPVKPTRVEPGAADVGPSRVSTRELQVDLRQPTSFESVYELRQQNRFASPGQESTPFFMRQNGGVTAVFPRSTYSVSRGGLVAQIPPNTVFYIGKLPESFSAPKPTRPRAANWIDPSIEAAERGRTAETPVPTKEPIAPAPERSIFADEEFRQHRVARLLQRAYARSEAGK